MARFISGNSFFHSGITPKKVFGLSAFFLFIFMIVAGVSLFVGSSGAGASLLIDAFTGRWTHACGSLADAEKTILLSIRLPRILFAGIVGGALSVAGVVFQALLRNPLADPYILGVYGGAAAGAVTGIMIGAGLWPFGVSGLAFLGAVLTIVFLFAFANRGTAMPSHTLLLTGVVTNAFFSAVVMFLITISKSTEIHGIMFWLMGDLSIADTGDILFAGALLAVGFVVIYLFARPLNLIVTGEETAMQLGVPVERTKAALLIVSSLMTAAAVSVSGIIGFVGLIIPHLMRMIVGPDHRLLLPASVLFGAAFLVAADTIARTAMAPAELPVGVVTALCGAPYFIYLLRKKGF